MSFNNYNLGSINYRSYNKNNQNNMNSHIAQGITFNNYSDVYTNTNKKEHGLLSKITSGFNSIIETMDTIESSQKGSEDLKKVNTILSHEDEMNRLLSEYSTMYNNYVDNSKNLNEEGRKKIEEDLLYKKERIALLSDNVKNEMDQLLKSNELTETTDTSQVNEGFENINLQNYIKIDETTTNAKIETTRLHMTSKYYFHLVYFILAITLISFTFNVMVNPNADVMNALFVLGGIILIFLISKSMS